MPAGIKAASLSGLAAAAVALLAMPAQGNAASNLYQAVVVVTGQGEANRLAGFRECLGKVLIRVSGDPTVTADRRFAQLRRDGARYVAGFRYRDRLSGVPMHDEQGSYDRPHDLTCLYQAGTVDAILADLGRKPWLGARPRLAVLLSVERGGKRFMVTQGDAEGELIRQSFGAAADAMAMAVRFPPENVDGSAPEGGAISLARKLGADALLSGQLTWSDRARGWISDWRLDPGGGEHHWSVRGVSFDEAFRQAVGGSAQILSGNGEPG
jgi:hypothetical protein